MRPRREDFREVDVFALVLGSVFLLLRERRQMTQTKLAEALGLTQTMLSRIERGQAQPEPFALRKMAETLGLEPGELHRLIDEALAQTASLVRETLPGVDAPWWQTAHEEVGLVRLSGLVLYVVSAQLARSQVPAAAGPPIAGPAPRPLG